jgi:GNAT superfamily N-acetyltransferase
VPAIVSLIGRVYAEYGFVYEPRAEVPDLFEFDAHYAPPRGGFFVVRDGASLVGSVGVELLDDGRAEIHRLYLDADRRGSGLGRALMDAALGWCRARGVVSVILWSDTRFERAHRLYARMGFARGGQRTIEGDVNDSREYFFERAV